MRVHDPRRFAEVLLAEDKGWSEAKVGSLLTGGSEVRAHHAHPRARDLLHGAVDDNGKLQTFGDLYGLDDSRGRQPFRQESPVRDASIRRRNGCEPAAGYARASAPATILRAINSGRGDLEYFLALSARPSVRLICLWPEAAAARSALKSLLAGEVQTTSTDSDHVCA